MVKTQNVNVGVLGANFVIVCVIRLGSYVFLTTDKNFKCPGCIVIEISALKIFLF